MARQVIWSRSATVLLQEILEYWHARNSTPLYSEKLYNLFLTALDQLAKYPESGRLTENIRVRYKMVRDYYLYYTFTDKELKVIAVCHVKRAPEYIDSILGQ